MPSTTTATTTTTTTTTTATTNASDYVKWFDKLLPQDVEAESKFRVVEETDVLRRKRRAYYRTVLDRSMPSCKSDMRAVLERGTWRDDEGILHWDGNKLCSDMSGPTPVRKVISPTGDTKDNIEHYVECVFKHIKPTTRITDVTWKQFFTPVRKYREFQKLPPIFKGNARDFREMMDHVPCDQETRTRLVESYVTGIWGKDA